MSDHVLRDAAGTELTYEEARKRAHDYICRYGSIHDIVDPYLNSLADDELLEWLIEPDGRGLFAESQP